MFAGADLPQHSLFTFIRYTNRHLNQHMVFLYCDEAQASLCKCADSPEPTLPAHEIFILIALSSDYTCTNVQTHRSL